jgi:hypothetical protein
MGDLLAGDGINRVAIGVNMVDTIRLRQGTFTTDHEKDK